MKTGGGMKIKFSKTKSAAKEGHIIEIVVFVEAIGVVGILWI